MEPREGGKNEKPRSVRTPYRCDGRLSMKVPRRSMSLLLKDPQYSRPSPRRPKVHRGTTADCIQPRLDVRDLGRA